MTKLSFLNGDGALGSSSNHMLSHSVTHEVTRVQSLLY